MGSVGNSTNISNNFDTLPSTDIKPLKPTQRSEQVFAREYTSLRRLAKDSIERNEFNNGGYNTLHSDDNEPVFSKRMMQGMQARLNSEWHGLELDAKLGVGTPEERRVKRYALTMLQKMMNRYYQSMYGKEI